MQPLAIHQRLIRVTRLGEAVKIPAAIDKPGFKQQPFVINGFTDLIVELYGSQRGRHARSAVGMAELPFGIPVEIEAEVAIET